MISVEFIPNNEGAACTFIGAVNARKVIEAALRRDLPSDFHGDVSGLDPLLANQLEAVRDACGEIGPATAACLTNRPLLSAYSKNGKVLIRLGSDDMALGHRVAETLGGVLRTASMGRGDWSVTVSTMPSRIAIAPHDTLFRIPRLELPIPCETEVDDLPWVEDSLGDAIYAAMINQALWSADPQEALRALPRRRAISAVVNSSNTHERNLLNDDLDVVSYSWASVETNVTVDGLVFIGLGISLCNGLLSNEIQ